MTLYHGTTESAAENIRVEGLRPNTGRGFKLLTDLTWLGRIPGERRPASFSKHHDKVYLTESRELAEVFAAFRAKYERARPGQKIYWGDPKVYNTPDLMATYFFKAEGEPKRDKPVVIELHIPDEFPLEESDSGEPEPSYFTTQPIPAEHVKQVIPVKRRKSTYSKKGE